MNPENNRGKKIHVIGGGLSGSEAALNLASFGFEVTVYECRPAMNMDVFGTGGMCELVCSNSLGSRKPESAPGILKSELAALGSKVLAAAEESTVPGGQALCVDRARLTAAVEARFEAAGIRVERREVRSLDEFPPNEMVLLASGPLTTPALFAELSKLLEARLYFYDAVAPVVDAASIDMQRAFYGNRYDKGTPDYLNIAMNREEYDAFYDALINAETVKPAANEKEIFFESCMPIEELARRGRHTLRFGPMKPKGFSDPRTQKMPYALIQLRAENNLFSAFNLVGFQTKMTFPEQKRILSLIPGLENVRILRHGVIHKNHYIYSPGALEFDQSLKCRGNVFVAGQLLGSEGYTEAIATGLSAALNIASRIATGEKKAVFENIEYGRTMLGSLLKYLLKSEVPMKKFFPMNSNFGIVDTAAVPKEDLPAASGAETERLVIWLKERGIF